MRGLTPAEVVREGARSRAILEERLGQPVTAFAYPYGQVDSVIQHLLGACGYVFGLSCRPGSAGFRESPLALPRIEVAGYHALGDFIAKLPG